MSTLLILVPALPLAAAILTALLGPRVLRGQSHWPIIVALGGAFVCSLCLAWQVSEGYQDAPDSAQSFSRVYTLWTWAAVDQDASNTITGGMPLKIDVAMRIDSLTAIMLSMVTFVSTLVAVYASGYMHGDRGYWRFFTYIGIFVFSMTMLVSVSNFLLLFVFWEAVGVSSYLLIGFWYEKPEAAAAGKKAFLVNRIGDFGFSIALFLIFFHYGTLNYHDTVDARPAFGVEAADISQESGDDKTAEPATQVAAAPGLSTPQQGVLSPSRIREIKFHSGGIGMAICLLLLVGACGKSAQFPLHVWLPDAMEGPTPVSALIHAATMVTAGVYMVTRCIPLFTASPDALLVVAMVGGFTALLAGLIALTQFDLKRVLAYSTISQLGYMFLSLGVGTMAGVTAGMFHLFTHAFFKALLFLAAGSVMHAMGNVIDMRRFGGLRKIMPITHWTFACGALALAGIVPFAGFWSKDSILGALHDKNLSLEAALVDRQAEHPPEHDDAEHHDHDAHAAGATPVDHAPRAAGLTVAAVAHAADAHGGGHGGHAAPPDPLLKHLTDDQLRRQATVYYWLGWVASFTALLTAFYTFRAFFMTFYGDEMVPAEAHGHAHESPPAMWVPLAVLAACATFVGLAFFATDVFSNFLRQTPSLALGLITESPAMTWAGMHMSVAVISTVVALIGVGAAAYFYLGSPREINVVRDMADLAWVRRLSETRFRSPWAGIARPLVIGINVVVFVALVLLYALEYKSFQPGTSSWLYHAAYLDAAPVLTASPWATEHYSAGVLNWLNAFELAGRNMIFIWLAVLVLWSLGAMLVYLSPIAIYVSPYKLSVGKFFFDQLYYFTLVWPLKVLAQLLYLIDDWVIDGLVNSIAKIPPAVGSLLRGMQMGLVQFYAVAMILGVLVIVFTRILLAG
ncbi:NADH-quinone oxidoreductase subunit L [Lignipirellula cremea]|uniref:NADH-quinone oxidoreductase subunit L n=1 Tax=Lignipirellula cremea TaxID=2528010 RepID=UPI0018D202AD|nr:NADH-quinone oxidoreductase subunit L [Lignipirellula cremea]